MSGGRIAFVVADLTGRGVQRVALNLVQEAARQGIPSDLVVLEARGALLDEVPSATRLVDLARPRVRQAFPALARYLRRERPEVAWVAEDHLNVLTLFARRMTGFPRRIAVSSHVPPGLWAGASSPLESAFWIRRLASLSYPWATVRVAISHEMADQLAELLRLARESITVVPNPVVTPDFLASAEGPPPHPWLEDRGCRVCLGIGSLRRGKGFDVLLQALALDAVPRDVRLLLLGSGPEEDALVRLAGDLGLEERVELVGYVREPGRYLAHADLFVLASRFEAFGNVLVEAMACGCPVVATDCSGGPREILEDGEHGPLVPPGAPEPLARAIRLRLDAPRASTTLRDAARRFHSDRILARYRELLEF